MITSVKLSKLQLSDANVRKTGPRGIEQLAADIEARGILQNLLVVPVKKPRGHLAVFAGGRRFAALKLLESAGKISGDYEVPVKTLQGTSAEQTETSLAENFQRMAMTPADECRAFQHFIGEGDNLDAVATRFGVTRRFVEGRLRLANLAEPIFAALSEGTLTLDKAKAYASTDDHAKQIRAFDTYGHQNYVNADSIRRSIAHETMKASDAIALLVGEDRYVAAGGFITRDLFEDDGDRWTNPEIAERIASELMTAEATRVGAETGLAWIRPIASTNTYSERADLYAVNLPQEPFTDEEAAAIAAIEKRMNAIAEAMEEEGLEDDAYDKLETEQQQIDAKHTQLCNKPRVLTDDLKPQVGAFLLLTPNGQLVLDTSYYSETLIRSADDDEQSHDHRPQIISPPKPEQVVPGGKTLSAKLGDALAMQRRDVLAAAILAQPGLALDYALFVMTDKNRSTSGSTISVARPSDPLPVKDIPAARATDYIAEVRDELDARWTEPHDEVERFIMFRGLDDDAKAAWLAMTVASSLEAKPAYRTEVAPLHRYLATTLEVDVASWWRPTSANFFDRVSKSSLLALLHDVGGAALSTRYAASKKPEVSASCQTLFAGDAIVEADVKEKALAWLPAMMRFDLEGPLPDIDEDADGEELDGAVHGDREHHTDPDGDDIVESAGAEADAETV